jgi:hypothetical protein
MKRRSKIAEQIKSARLEAVAIGKEHGRQSLQAIRARRRVSELRCVQLRRQLAYQKRQNATWWQRLLATLKSNREYGSKAE